MTAQNKFKMPKILKIPSKRPSPMILMFAILIIVFVLLLIPIAPFIPLLLYGILTTFIVCSFLIYGSNFSCEHTHSEQWFPELYIKGKVFFFNPNEPMNFQKLYPNYDNLFTIIGILLILSIILLIIALINLIKRRRSGWIYLFFSVLAFNFNFLVLQNYVGFSIILLLSLYTLFQIRKRYKKIKS